jgi:hypothetical protein
MSKENDEFVENLLRGLPNAEPISEFELRRFEKIIDRQAADYKSSKRPSRFKSPTSIAASIAIVFGAVFVLSNQNSVTAPSTIVTASGSTTESSDSNSTEGQISPTPVQSNSGGSNEGSSADGGVFENSAPPENLSGAVAVFSTNLDYSTDRNRISKVVILPSAPGSTSALQNTVQQCAIKLGISKALLAYDLGFFQGERAQAFYSGMSKTGYRIILVDSDCNLLSEL